MRSFRSISSHLSRIHRATSTQNPTFTSQTTHTHNLLASAQSKFVSNFTSSAQESNPAPTQKVSAIVDEISGLTLLEVGDLVEVLRTKLDMKDMPMMAVMMPGTQFGGVGAGTVRGSAGPAKGEQEKAEKTAFDLKLDGYDAAAKIKVIKEVRAFTDLGLKEAKDLVEKAPTLLKKGVTKEEADKIVQKMKEIGAKVSVE